MKHLKRNAGILVAIAAILLIFLSLNFFITFNVFDKVWDSYAVADGHYKMTMAEKGRMGMEQMTNNLVIVLLGLLAVLIAVSQLKAVQRKLGKMLIGDILSAALFTALFIPFIWACLALMDRFRLNTGNGYVLVLIVLSFSLFFRSERAKSKARMEMKASQRKKQGKIIRQEVNYSKLFEIIREQNQEAKGKVLLVNVPQDLMELSISGSILITQEEIMDYVRHYFGMDFIALIHEPSQQRVFFIAA